MNPLWVHLRVLYVTHLALSNFLLYVVTYGTLKATRNFVRVL